MTEGKNQTKTQLIVPSAAPVRMTGGQDTILLTS
jgi:hypothetical protein